MGRRIGLTIRAKGAPAVKAQQSALAAVGIAEEDIWNDTSDRRTLAGWVLSGRAVREGDTVTVATPHALGATTRQQNAAEKKLKSMGIAVEHAETGEGPVRKRGRPKVHKFTEAQEKELRDMWKKPNMVTRDFVRDKAEEFAGQRVSDATLKRMFGSRGSE